MVMSIAVEAVERGDRVVLWFGEAPQNFVVSGIAEGIAVRTLMVCHNGASLELNVQRGHTVDLTC